MIRTSVTCPPKTGPVKMWVFRDIKAGRRTHHEEEPIYGGADHWDSEGGRSGADGEGALPEAWHLRSDLLPLEVEVRWVGRERSAPAAAVGRRESATEADGGRAGAAHPGIERGAGKKVLTPT